MKKKSISLAALAVSASTSFAFIGPVGNMEEKTYCLTMHRDSQGSVVAGTCDESENNRRQNLRVGANGCTRNQIALTTFKRYDERNFPISIVACLPPNVTQL